ncbi:hypothetical protein MBLL_00371 (plasmid) [Methylobacterium bullatum]|uniref:Uncharacterized protein n=1 Tax=Methylobacterium bullatum TaxID=570505 RepID=A0A679JKE7_9HYPH|nr:hypothetical protein MBLL_00371 [Methylobacterium bullatum]
MLAPIQYTDQAIGSLLPIELCNMLDCRVYHVAS